MINRDKIDASLREIITAIADKNIETRAIWGLINEQKPYLGEETYMIEKAPYYATRIINLPSSTQITNEEIEYVVKCVKSVLEDFAK